MDCRRRKICRLVPEDNEALILIEFNGAGFQRQESALLVCWTRDSPMKTPRKGARAKRSFEERLGQRVRSRKVADAKLRARQAQGKIRRFVITNFRKQNTIDSLALRRGECNRCGACCELVFKCPFLKKQSDGTSLCGIYENRPNSCRLFPIEQRDIQEVRGSCSYYFIEKPVRLGKAS